MRSNKHVVAIVAFATQSILLCAASTYAFARTQLAEASVAAAKPTEDEQLKTAWSAAYAEARAAMLAGDFAAAAGKFSLLVGSAPDAGSRFLVVEMMSACRTWATGGLVLSRPQGMALVPPALLADHRTTDEISILYTNAVLFGLYAGIVLDAYNKPNSPGSAILPPLLMGGVAAGTIAILDKSLNLRYGVAQSIVSGLYIGIEEAVCWALWHEASAPGSSEWGEKTVMAFVLGMGTLGAAAGGVLGSYVGTTPGRASLMGSAAMWSGLVAGTLMGGVTDNSATAMLSSAIMLNVGAAAGLLATAQVSPSIARVRFIDLGGLSGGLIVGGLYWTLRDKETEERGLLTATSLGMAAGLLTSWILTRDMEPDQPRKGRELSFTERLVPTVVPATHGTGMVVGVAAQI